MASPASTPPRPGARPGRKPRTGDELELVVGEYDRRGYSLGRAVGVDGVEYDVRFRGGVPGDRWRALVLKRKRGRLDVRGLELLEAGPVRVAARCSHHASCGGCSFQQCDYGSQLEAKRELVRAALAASGLSSEAGVEAVVGCEPPWAYRNKMEFSFGSRRFVENHEPEGAPADFALGLHAPGIYQKVLDLSECGIVFAGGEAILSSAREFALELGLAP